MFKNFFKKTAKRVMAFYGKNWKTGVLVSLAALFIIFLPHGVANAFGSPGMIAAGSVGNQGVALDSDMVNWIEAAEDKITFLMLLINRVLWAILVIVGPLLDNSMLFSSCVKGTGTGANFVCEATMEDNLLGIWVQIRNIVNILFVVILVFTALYNVIGKTEGEFVLKTMLPKIIIGLIAVNFSFLASKVILDAANVATTAVAAIPVNIKEDLKPENFESYKDALGETVCNYIKPGTEEKTPLTSEQIEQWGLNGICTTGGVFVQEFGTGFLKNFTHTNLAFIMTAEIAKLSQLKFVSLELNKVEGIDLSTFEQVMNFILDIAVNLGIIVVYAVSVLALLAVAVARIVVLWLMIALSPLVVLFIVIPQLGQGLGDLDLKSTFIQHAIAPVIMVGSLSLGFILLDSMVNEEGFKLFNNTEGHNVINDVVSGNFENMHLGDLLALIGGVMVIWTGVFGAANKTYAKFITEKLSSFTKDGATFLAKLPLYATPIPVTTLSGGRKGVPLAHALKGLEGVWQNAENKLGGTDALDASFKDTFLEDPNRAKNTLMRDLGKSENLEDVKKSLPKLLIGAKLDEDDWKTAQEKLREVTKKAPAKEVKGIESIISALGKGTLEERINALTGLEGSGVTVGNADDITKKQTSEDKPKEEKKEGKPDEAKKIEGEPKKDVPPDDKSQVSKVEPPKQILQTEPPAGKNKDKTPEMPAGSTEEQKKSFTSITEPNSNPTTIESKK